MSRVKYIGRIEVHDTPHCHTVFATHQDGRMLYGLVEGAQNPTEAFCRIMHDDYGWQWGKFGWWTLPGVWAHEMLETPPLDYTGERINGFWFKGEA